MEATCGRCGAQAGTFSSLGERDDLGDCCVDCHIVTVTRGLELARATEASKFRKLKILFGDWWPHYTPPRELRYTLYFERRSCPYCGEEVGPCDTTGTDDAFPFESHAHIDHMDPLNRGGHDAWRNAVYCCGRCNLAKGRMTFVMWAASLTAVRKEAARQVYVEKHGHQPEEFVGGTRQPRFGHHLLVLNLSEEALRGLYPRPIVKGPPQRSWN